jgi:hypothetical protein
VNLHVPAGNAALAELPDQPRFKLPARLVIDGVSYRARDWSRNAVRFLAPRSGLVAGDSFAAELSFDLPGGALSTPIDTTVDAVKGDEIDLAFTPAPGADLSAIDFVIEDYLAGRITAMDGMLTKSETLRAAPRQSAVAESGIGSAVRRLLGLGLITLIGALALYFLGTSAYDRLFVFDAASAQVAFPSVEVDAPIAGTLTAMAPLGTIANGAPLFKIADAAGTETAIPSPCNCELVSIERTVGSYVGNGGSVVKLVRHDSAATVLVAVAFPDMRRVYDGAAVDLKFLDGQVVRGAHVAAIRSLAGEQSGLVTLEVDPGRTLQPAQFGEPVYATFDAAPWRRSR